MNILATQPDGKKIFHGILERGIFRRNVTGHDVRLAGQCFTLNVGVARNLRQRNCATLEFLWTKRDAKELYRISFELAMLKHAKNPKASYHGDIHIPVEACYLFSRQEFEPKPEPRRPVERPPELTQAEPEAQKLF